MSGDIFDRVNAMLEQARQERDSLKFQREQARLEVHQLRRRVEAFEQQCQLLNESNKTLQKQLDAAERRAEKSQRAMLDHAARA